MNLCNFFIIFHISFSLGQQTIPDDGEEFQFLLWKPFLRFFLILDPFHCTNIVIDQKSGRTIMAPTNACRKRCKEQRMDAACIGKPFWPNDCSCIKLNVIPPGPPGSKSSWTVNYTLKTYNKVHSFLHVFKSHKLAWHNADQIKV